MQPTCTEKGYTGYQCSGCNDTEIDENSYVNAVGHNPKIENYKAATCTEDGIVNGVGDGKFAPNALVTREQLVAMLYRYAEKPEVSNELTDFADANKISDYAVSAVKWAVEQDILRGDGSPRKLRPTDYAKRCEVAAMLHRYIV
mgnify:CR=1 FL=1